MQTLTKANLKSYLTSNAYIPVYVVTLEGEINTKIVYDGCDVIGMSYTELDAKGEPYKVKVPLETLDLVLEELCAYHVIYTVDGMKNLLDKLDSTDPKKEEK